MVAVHAWSCALRINLTLRAHASAADFVAATSPISSQLLVGLDLDPASTDDFRHVASHTLAPDGYVVGGIQMTESPPEGVDTGEPSANHAHHAHHAHVKGNAYNFASSPQHASSFALVQGQLAGVPCFRTRRGAPLGCVEVAFNWCAPSVYSNMAATLRTWQPPSSCMAATFLIRQVRLALPAGRAPRRRGADDRRSPREHERLAERRAPHNLPNMAIESNYRPGWVYLYSYLSGVAGTPRLAERCAAQRHFLGYRYEPRRSDNLRNPYLLRQLMGFCLFHGCEEVGTLARAGDLAAHGVAPLSDPPVEIFAGVS